MTCHACPQPAVALIAAPWVSGAVSLFAIVRPVDSPVQVGEAVCIHHVHLEIDQMLMRAQTQESA